MYKQEMTKPGAECKGQHHEQDESQTHNLETLDWPERDEVFASRDAG